MTDRSDFPYRAAAGLPKELTDYWEKRGRRVAAIADYSTDAATSAAAVAQSVPSAVATTAATNASPYGYSQAQADALVAAVNSLLACVSELQTIVGVLRTDAAANAIVVNGLSDQLNALLAAMRASGKMAE